MENWELNNIIQELQNGKHLTMQLLNVPSSSTESPQILLDKILFSFHKTISMLNSSPRITTGMSESPASFSGSPSDHHQRWKQQVRVIPGMELEGLLDDGYNWRKYGQKHTLGAKFPRGYYRCTHGIIGGCSATKQVQRSDQDPTIFDITYHGTHTCTHNSLTFSPSQPPPENQEPQAPENQEPQQLSHEQLLFNFHTYPTVAFDFPLDDPGFLPGRFIP
ncbi:probable WRKY transcription factor 53 [Euphorbia lathyris]|uniref:probable WRKY transcription factor 53 n=1 Tax=Euphorbia lathyris TaxID=212925 RepID=UPI00331333C0